MRLLRQFSALSRASSGAPIIEISNASIYPLGETTSPYFTDLTWRIHESETWAVVGPSSSGRRVLLEVRCLSGKSKSRSFKGNIGSPQLRLFNIRFYTAYKVHPVTHTHPVRFGRAMSFIICGLPAQLQLHCIIQNDMKHTERLTMPLSKTGFSREWATSTSRNFEKPLRFWEWTSYSMGAS
jgi:hypothetical protein